MPLPFFKGKSQRGRVFILDGIAGKRGGLEVGKL
jgi:hypothetical protein